MDAQKLLNTLIRCSGKDWTITFDDEDAYSLASLDIHTSDYDEDSDFGEIDVQFSDCINSSEALKQAMETPREHLPQICYDEEGKGSPVGKAYSVREIKSVFDNDNNCFILDSDEGT